MNELIGKYLNGYKIVKIENDPFVKGQINLWTDEVITEYFGDRSVVKFFVREESNSAKIYQELVDKEKYDLQQRINKAIHRIQLLQMDGEVTVRDLGLIARDLKGDNNE